VRGFGEADDFVFGCHGLTIAETFAIAWKFSLSVSTISNVILVLALLPIRSRNYLCEEKKSPLELFKASRTGEVKMNTKEISKKESMDRSFLSDFPSLRDWFEDFAPERFAWLGSDRHTIKVEELIRTNEIIVRAELPGIDPDKDVHLHISNGMLTISGEREEQTKTEKRSEFYYGSFSRTIPLPAGTTEKGVKASYRDGILEIHIPTPEMTERPKRIPIEKM